MESQEEKFHVFACPAARRAIRQNNHRVMWCLKDASKVLDGKFKFSDTRQPGMLSPGTIFKTDFVDNFFTPDFTLTTHRSRLHNNEVVMLISQHHGLQKAVFELMLKRCKPVPLI